MTKETLVIRQLRASRGNAFRIQIEQLRVEEGEVLALLGPNGSGKTTLLLAIAHLIEPEHAIITFDGDPQLWSRPMSLRRQIALVLQDPLLVDGTVWDNVTLGLRFRGTPRQQLEQQAVKWMKRLGIAHIGHRKVSTLSSGEARRTSLARALALEPRLLLLDEPFSALDPGTRTTLLDELRPILREARVSTILVTHDRTEAMALGDRIAIMMGGQIRQIGTPEEVFSTPVDAEVAELVGPVNILPGQVTEVAQGISRVLVGTVSLESMTPASPGEAVYVLIRPEAVTLWKGIEFAVPTTARNMLRGKVRAVLSAGPHIRVSIDCSGFHVSALITRASAGELALVPGDQVTASFKATDTYLVRR
jgi:tungstate transport system ATP-binding protein